jgi:hypothetical protein
VVDVVVDIVSIDDPVPPEGRATLAGETVIDAPGSGLFEDKLIVPANPLRLTRERVELPEDP